MLETNGTNALLHRNKNIYVSNQLILLISYNLRVKGSEILTFSCETKAL